MIKTLLAKILTRLKNDSLGPGPHTLTADFPPNSLLRHHSQLNLLERSTLRITPGQIAYLITNGQYSPAYQPGDYPLDPENIPQTEIADILYMNIDAGAERYWQSAYQPPQRPLEQPLNGSYTISIQNPETLCRTIIEHQAIELDDDLIDQWLSYAIDRTLIDEHISADDIDLQAEPLQNFLKARLRPQLTAIGLILHDLRIARRPGTRLRPQKRTQAPPPPKLNPAYTRNNSTAMPNTAPEKKRPLLGEDKIYYRVQHGQQIGPLSANDIQKLINEGQMLAKDLLWQKGMTTWLPADAFNLFNWN